MKVLGIIPSRYESSRFPGKPLIDIGGKSMIRRVYEGASKAQSLSKLVVATDDQRIFDEVVSFGGEVIMTHGGHGSGTERCGEVIEKYSDYDVVINIQGDEPLINPDQIDLLAGLFSDAKVQIGTLIRRIEESSDLRNPHRIKVVLDYQQLQRFFENKWLDKAAFYKHIGIYAWRIQTLEELLDLPVTDLEKWESLEQLRWLYYGYKIRTEETNIETPNIDVPEDLEKVMKVLLKG